MKDIADYHTKTEQVPTFVHGDLKAVGVSKYLEKC